MWLEARDWGREKARQLFQYMVTHWRQLVLKERIVAELWPELDPDRADRDFKVALNALNSALEMLESARPHADGRIDRRRPECPGRSRAPEAHPPTRCGPGANSRTQRPGEAVTEPSGDSRWGHRQARVEQRPRT